MNRRAQEQREFEIPCEFCSSLIQSAFYNSHLKVCSKEPQSKNLDREEIPCELCGKGIPFDMYEKHAKSHLKHSHHHNHHHHRRSHSREQWRENGPNLEDHRHPTNASLHENIRSRPSQQFSPIRIVTRDPFFEDDLDLESFFEDDFPFRRPSSMTTMMTSRRFPFPGWSLFDSFFEDVRRHQPGMIQRNPAPELFRVFVEPRHNVRFYERFIGQEDDNRPPQGFKPKELDRNFITTKYDEKKSKELQEENKKCLICLAEFENGEELRFLECCHRFHKNCIDQWLKSSTTCPICKKDFKDFRTY